jgi:hypothetical protein
MKIDLKFFSQLDNKIPENFQRQSCGLCCVKMLIDYYNPQTEIEISNLLKEAELIGAYDTKINNGVWTYEGLVRLLRNHNVLSYDQEFRSVKVDLEKGEFLKNENQTDFIHAGLSKIVKNIKNKKPIIVSVKAGFSDNVDSHLVVLNGIEEKSNFLQSILFVNDPLVGPDIEMTLEYFLKFWRKMAIFGSKI